MAANHHLETYIKELKKVYYLTSSMQKSSDLSQILNIMLKECISITDATSGSIMFRHRQSDRLFFYAYQGLDPNTVSHTQMSINDGIAGTVITENVPKIINNIDLDPKYLTIDSKVHSEMAVPITVKTNTLGVIILDHTSTGMFTDKHLELVQMVCNYTGFIISHYIETLISEKNTRLIENMITISSVTSAEDVFKILTKELQAHSTCIVDTQGQILFSEGSLVAPLNLTPEYFEKSHSFILSVENDQKIPYTRIIIPRTQKDMVFVADKTYLFSESTRTDIYFADKILEFLVTKDSKFHHDETLSQWAERKMSAPHGHVYDLAIGSVEKELITVALKKNKDNKLKTAQFLGINRNTLRHKMEIHGLEK